MTTCQTGAEVTPTSTARRTVREHPLPGPTLAATSAATFVALTNYLAPALTVPRLAPVLHTSPSSQAWLINGTSLGLAALLLVSGRLADDYGRRRVFLLGTLGLAVTASLTVVTGDTLLFTLARVAQGAASAAILASSLGLLVHAFPSGGPRIRATGIWGAFVSAGTAAGPLLAGALSGFDWRLVYGVIAVAALLVAGCASRVLAESRAARRARSDVAGATVLGLAFTALLSALTLGRGGWLRLSVLLLFVAAVTLLAVFVRVERRTPAPLIEPGFLRRASFQASVAGALFTGLASTAFFSYVPLLVEQDFGMSVMATAWLYVAWSGTSALVAPQTRRLPSRISVRQQMAMGFALHVMGVVSMLGAVGAGSEGRLLPGVFVAGIGSGLINAALPRLAVESVPHTRAAMGSGANNTARYIGSAAGVALLIAVTTSAGSPATAANLAIALSAGLALLGTFTMLTRNRAATRPATTRHSPQTAQRFPTAVLRRP